MKINANGTEIDIILSKSDNSDYISLTDITKYKNPEDPRFAIQNWMRNRNIIDLESMNADLIRQNIPAKKRLKKLREVAYYQLESIKKIVLLRNWLKK